MCLLAEVLQWPGSRACLAVMCQSAVLMGQSSQGARETAVLQDLLLQVAAAYELCPPGIEGRQQP